MQQNEESLYERYCRVGRRVEIIGGAVFAVGAAAYALTGGHTASAVVMFVGLLAVVFGVANLRPNNKIKTFAAQLTNTPDAVFAQGLLEAITKNGKTLLSGRSLSNVEQAILVYEQSEGADKAMADALREAVQKHLRKMLF